MEIEIERMQAYLSQINQLLKRGERFNQLSDSWEIVHLELLLSETDR